MSTNPKRMGPPWSRDLKPITSRLVPARPDLRQNKKHHSSLAGSHPICVSTLWAGFAQQHDLPLSSLFLWKQMKAWSTWSCSSANSRRTAKLKKGGGKSESMFLDWDSSCCSLDLGESNWQKPKQWWSRTISTTCLAAKERVLFPPSPNLDVSYKHNISSLIPILRLNPGQNQACLHPPNFY